MKSPDEIQKIFESHKIKNYEKLKKALEGVANGTKYILMCPSLKLVGKDWKGSPGCSYELDNCEFCDSKIYLGKQQKQNYKYDKSRWLKICDLCMIKIFGRNFQSLLDNNTISFEEIQEMNKH